MFPTPPRAFVAGALLISVGACGGSPVSNAQSPGGTATPPPPSLITPTAAATPGTDALPTPSIVFKAETCAADAACRRVAVARVKSRALTPPIPCHEDGSTCVLTLDLYYPAEPPADGHAYPVAVMERGGPDFPGTQGTLALLLAAQGVVVVDGSWRQATAYGAGGTIGMGDIGCAVRAARALGPQVGGDPGRITLLGHSLGAWAGAVVALTKGGIEPVAGQCTFTTGSGAPEAFGGLAGPYTGVADWPDDMGWADIVGGTPSTAPDAWAAVDPLALIQRYGPPGIPLVLIHGDADEVTPIDGARRLAAALTAAGLPTTVVVEPGIDHGEVLGTPATIQALLGLLLPT